MKCKLLLSFYFLILISNLSFAHSGRTNVKGCHNDRINGGYHCHNSGRSSSHSKSRTSKFIPSLNKGTRIRKIPRYQSANYKNAAKEYKTSVHSKDQKSNSENFKDKKYLIDATNIQRGNNPGKKSELSSIEAKDKYQWLKNKELQQQQEMKENLKPISVCLLGCD